MSHEIIGILGIAAVVLLLIARMWIGLAMTMVGFFGLAFLKGIDRIHADEDLAVIPNDLISQRRADVAEIADQIAHGAPGFKGHGQLRGPD